MNSYTATRRVLGFLLLVAFCFSVLALSIHSGAADGKPFEGDEEPLIPILARGIDVSAYQGDIDWARVKAAGVDFVILRASGGVGKDQNFEANYTAAHAVGLGVGAYYCTAATTPEQAEKEADLLLTWLEGKRLEYPVYFDIEGDDQSALPDNAARTALCTAFVGRMKQAGWCAGVYSYKSWFETMLDLPALMQESEIWWAHWPQSGQPDIDYSRYGLWQYASDGRVDGVNGDVDVDVAFTDYPRLMKQRGWNGYPVSPALVSFGDVNDDGTVDTADAVLTLQYAAELIDGRALNTAAADVNGDGAIDTADAVLILQYAAELIDRFPAQPAESETTTEPSGATTRPDTTESTTTASEPTTTATDAPPAPTSSDAPATTTSEPAVTTSSESAATTTTSDAPMTTTTASSRPSGITLPFVPA